MNTIIHWLEHLNVLMPSGHIALVGAGNGKGVWAQWLVHQAGKSRVTLIEAEPTQYSTLQRTLKSLGEHARHCEIRNALVGAQPGPASFFVTSSQQESGLLDPQSLLNLWPNLQTEEIRELSAITLDTVYGDPSGDAELPLDERHWVIIDCLPSGELLRASCKLELVDVVIARVLLGERHAVPDGASLEEVAELLQQNGMLQIAVEATRHPGIGYALFVRDVRLALHAQVQKHHSESQELRLNSEEQAKLLVEFRAKTEQLMQSKLVVEQQSQERAQQLEQLGKARDEQTKLAQDRLAQIERLTQAKAAVEKQSQERLVQTEQLTQAKTAAEKQLQERAQQLEQLTKARDEQVKLAQERLVQTEQLTQAKAAAEKQSQERGQQLEQLGKARDEQARLAQERQVQIEQLKVVSTALQKNEVQEKQFKEFQQQLESSLGERIGKVLAGQIDAGVKAQTEAFLKLLQSNLSETKEGLQGVVNASETKVKNELGKGLANSVKQLESFMNIQSFFSSGDFFSDFHGWPISPDIGVFLLEKMRSQNYDLIIEFGSGTSTALFAKAAEAMSGKTQKSAVPKTLKTEIVTFEHNQLYHEKTQKMLRARKLDWYVNLIHAPLIDWKDERQDYLYYDCQSVLEDLAEKYKSQKIKILVLVDGPPGSTCKNARYPAVPIIFNAFAKQSIDIVLDDASRPEEKATIDLWREFYKKRSIAIEESSIPSEKGIHISSQII
ncbi:hypothetical protein F3J24_02845 [Comamonas sp. Tr-654]|uniref:hypothetical protein n=1 Tax=Comamonas sp. Tr-654 TaxID=2608341 RepID=UPI00142106A3|nr:hypothetical protein [Comamonas sp. Tr-654]NIF82447.1 hypothetical protein [Comamonas sp. Tr-654]